MAADEREGGKMANAHDRARELLADAKRHLECGRVLRSDPQAKLYCVMLAMLNLADAEATLDAYKEQPR